MPNTPAQFPNFDLPGAEWFSLAPNANIAIQGRRRRVTNPNGFLDLSSGSGALGTSIQIETAFTSSAAIYVHAAWIRTMPTSGDSYVITSALGLNVNSVSVNNIDFPLGQGLASPIAGTTPVIIVMERDRLITQRDLAAFAANPGPNLNLALYASATAAVGSTNRPYVIGFIVYTRLDGFTE